MLKTIAALLLLAAPVLAAPASQPTVPASTPHEEARPQTVTRVYDVQELVREIPNYPLDPSMIPTLPSERKGGGSPLGALAAPAATPERARRESLVKLIEDTVDAESWKDTGGTVGAISELSGRLVITQTEPGHEKVQKLLSALLADLQRIVRVNATWLLLTHDEMQSLRDSSLLAGGGAIVRLDDKALRTAKVYCRGQTLGFIGQTVHIVSGIQRSYVSELTPVVGQNAVGYSATIGTIHSGVAMQVTPQLTTSRKAVVLDLENIVSEASGIANQGAAGAAIATTQPAAANATEPKAIDRPTITAQEFRTTVQIPLGVNVVIGGMTFDPDSHDEPSRQLYLVIEADVSE